MRVGSRDEAGAFSRARLSTCDIAVMSGRGLQLLA